MTPLQIVLLILLVPITLFNFLFLTSGRKKNKEGRMQYQRIMSELSEKAVRELGQSKTMVVFPYLSDSDVGCLLCIDRKKDLEAIVTDAVVLKMKISSPKSCEILSETDGVKMLGSLSCRVDYPETGESLEIPFGSKPHRINGYIGRFLVRNAEEFKKRILEAE